MTTFVVLFIGLLAVVLILTPLIIHLSREVGILRLTLHDARLELVTAVRDADYHRMASEHASDGLVVQDMKARILWANPAYLKIFGVTFDEIVGRNPLEFALPPNDAVSPDEIEAFRYCADDPQDWSLHERLNRHNDGREFWNQMNSSYNLAPDGTQNAIVVCRDVTEQMEQKQKLHETSNKLQHEATHDGLTGVPNRAAFKTFIGDALRSGDGTPVGLLHIDLDNFKAVNDTHGHSGGDAVLTHTADVIRQNIRDSDLLARVGGDEFVVVCPQTSDLALLDDLSTRLLDVISKPFAWSNRLLKIEASIGAAISQSEKNRRNLARSGRLCTL